MSKKNYKVQTRERLNEQWEDSTVNLSMNAPFTKEEAERHVREMNKITERMIEIFPGTYDGVEYRAVEVES